MSERFFIEPAVAAEHVTLEGDEARHLIRVMRAAIGEEIILFDGSGAEFLARIAEIGKSAVGLDIVERRSLDRELPFDLTLAVALPKGDRQKWLVEKATELGVTTLVPLITARGVAQPVESALARLRRTVIEASKQCGRNRLMQIGDPITADAFFMAGFSSSTQHSSSAVRSEEAERSRSNSSASLCLIADPSGAPLSALAASPGPKTAAIGPEGGFTSSELTSASEHGWKGVSLGKSILRVETAAVAIASWAALR